jgi:YHS domain-containing protein
METLRIAFAVVAARTAFALAAVALGLQLGGCGTTHATIPTSRGEQLMLLGYDPVGYFSDGRPVRGKHTLAATHVGRTYYFATTQHREAFAAAPAKYEPQYGGFCSNGAPYGVKMGSDPTQFEIRGGRLFMFGDIQGREMWLLDEADNIRHADELWPSIEDKPWRTQSLKAWAFKVPWYRDGPSLMARWREKHPGQELNYDTGGTLNNVLFKYPGWRAREGYSQPALGVPGEPDDPLKGK